MVFNLHPCYSKNPSRSGQRIAIGLIGGIVSLICYVLSESIKKERLELKQKSKEIRTKERNEIKINKKKESIKSKYNKFDIINDIKLHHKLLKNRYTSRNIGQIRVYIEEYHPQTGKYKENYYIILYVPGLYSNYMVFNNKFEVFTYLDKLYRQ